MKKSHASASIAGHFGILVLFTIIGYIVGDFFGAFVGACFAYSVWWLKEIHDMLYERIHTKQNE